MSETSPTTPAPEPPPPTAAEIMNAVRAEGFRGRCLLVAFTLFGLAALGKASVPPIDLGGQTPLTLSMIYMSLNFLYLMSGVTGAVLVGATFVSKFFSNQVWLVIGTFLAVAELAFMPFLFIR